MSIFLSGVSFIGAVQLPGTDSPPVHGISPTESKLSKFLRKVASAFVVMDEREESSEAPRSAEGIDEIAQDASALIAQLQPSGSAEAASAAPAPSGGEAEMLDLTAEDVFRSRNVPDSPNSALRLIKVIAGIAMFPKDQQLALVRAMDAADDTWSEAEVVRDARHRQEILRAHLNEVTRERAQRSAAVDREITRVKESGDAVLAELDRRISELHTRREQEAQATAQAVSQLEQQLRDLETRELRARQGSSQVIQALSGLLTFLGAPPPADSK